MRKTLKKSLAIFGILYALLSLLAIIHFPITIKNSVRNHAYTAFLLPFYAPPIIRSYIAFVSAGTWPFGAKQGVLDHRRFVARHALRSEFGEKVVDFNLTPDVLPGREGRVLLTLGSEHFTTGMLGAFYDAHGGGVVKIGRYFCELPTERPFLKRLFSPPNCIEFIRHPDGELYLQRLGSEKPLRITLLP